MTHVLPIHNQNTYVIHQIRSPDSTYHVQSVIPKSARKGTMSYLIIGPLVDALFVYLKQHEHEVPGSGKLREGFTYALNQEQYLRVFLTDGDVPMDNNASERAIRGFCIGKRNWQVIDTINGATSSAIIYSIAETAKQTI